MGNTISFLLNWGRPFEMNSLLSRSIDGLQEGQSITVYTVNVNEQEYALAIYQVPENFVHKRGTKETRGS